MATVTLGPAPVDLSGIRAGDLNRFTMTLKRSGVPVDLTGSTVTAQARTSTITEDPLDAVVDILNAAQGQLAVRWPGDAVRTWLASKATARGVWDLQVDNGTDPDPVALAAGAFNAEMDVTRP